MPGWLEPGDQRKHGKKFAGHSSNTGVTSYETTPPKFNMEPENDGFQ